MTSAGRAKLYARDALLGFREFGMAEYLCGVARSIAGTITAMSKHSKRVLKATAAHAGATHSPSLILPSILETAWRLLPTRISSWQRVRSSLARVNPGDLSEYFRFLHRD